MKVDQSETCIHNVHVHVHVYHRVCTCTKNLARVLLGGSTSKTRLGNVDRYTGYYQLILHNPQPRLETFCYTPMQVHVYIIFGKQTSPNLAIGI